MPDINKTICLVDRREVINRSNTNALKLYYNNALNIQSYTDSDEAWIYITKEKPNIVISDSYQLVKQIKNTPDLINITAVLTGTDPEGPDGVVSYLAKPYGLKEMLKYIEG